MKTPTPRTDAERRSLKKSKSYPPDPVSAEFARQLERELITVKALADRLAEASKACFNALERIGWPNEAETLREALAAYEKHKQNTP